MGQTLATERLKQMLHRFVPIVSRQDVSSIDQGQYPTGNLLSERPPYDKVSVPEEIDWFSDNFSRDF